MANAKARPLLALDFNCYLNQKRCGSGSVRSRRNSVGSRCLDEVSNRRLASAYELCTKLKVG